MKGLPSTINCRPDIRGKALASSANDGRGNAAKIKKKKILRKSLQTALIDLPPGHRLFE
jgi:hypothetical protein